MNHLSRIAALLVLLMVPNGAWAQGAPGHHPDKVENRANAPVTIDPEAPPLPSNSPLAQPIAPTAPASPLPPGGWPNAETWKSLQTVGLFAAISLGPVAILMLTSFVRINIVLILLRQALGSPQVPGNQVLSALAVLLTVLVMKPAGEAVYTRAIVPYTQGKLTPAQAWELGSKPIKTFMVDQIVRTNHQHYLTDLYDYAVPPSPGRVTPEYGDEYPFHVLATAFLISELTTALVIGFMIYLPFLVTDLVVSSVLAAMGLVMMPPSLVSMPLKLILFVMADGWFLVASRMLQTFTVSHTP